MADSSVVLEAAFFSSGAGEVAQLTQEDMNPFFFSSGLSVTRVSAFPCCFSNLHTNEREKQS